MCEVQYTTMNYVESNAKSVLTMEAKDKSWITYLKQHRNESSADEC